jgi:putative Mg2+ transporter-C (MgtC) family protein
MAEDFNILLRLLVALVLAGTLGWERESAGKAAGIRTHMLVGMGAALFVSVGELFVHRFTPLADGIRFDPSRIIVAVVTGISFLGAGTIFVAREKGAHVRGLTTAASIWVTAGLGMVVGLERYVLAIGITVLVLGVLHLLGILEQRLWRGRGGPPDEGGEKR